MAKNTDIRLVEAYAQQERIAYRTPIKFGGRVVNDAVIFDVTVAVETAAGLRGVGHGSMPLGNVWAWPSAQVPAEQTLAAMVLLASRLAEAALGVTETGHPLDLAEPVAELRDRIAQQVQQELGLAEPLPMLARLVAASPLDAAIHDAYGKALQLSSFAALGPDFVSRDLSAYLNDDFRGEYLDQYTLAEPKPRLPLYHLVGALDPLTPADISQRIDDGLPETLPEWIIADGLTHLKIKLNGDDLAWDVERVVAIERVTAQAQSARGCTSWNYSLDFNEKCRDVGYVLDFLDQLEQRAPSALGRVQYIEQPTARDLRANPENRMHAAAARKPVVIDESLTDLESLLLCRELGYSGVALKACKGQTESLLMGAAAQKYGMFLCVQDLTCPGASFLHSASLAAHIPTVAAIEGNGRQYCPAGNTPWLDRYPGMFRLSDGTLETAVLAEDGLGFSREQ